MANIKLLPESLINQIAAGEVIERPYSVVKELVENSIDAMATHISVEIVSGGLEAIIVSDDGNGMNIEDAKLAWERHATSKIASAEDLFNIGTLGFRGEALASIASVSRAEMETKEKGSVSGISIELNGGEIVSESACGCPEGTKISVFNLFFNTPARRKYIKNANTEQKHIVELIQSLALANPGIAFRLLSDGKINLDLSPSTLEDRIAKVLGSEIAQNMLPFYVGGAGFKITGFVGKPAISRSNRKGQYVFLNGRVIQNHLISHAVKEAFHSMLMHGKHPWFLLNLQVAPQDVDINTHPRKLEVRFLKQEELYKAVFKGVSELLNKNSLIPNVGLESGSPVAAPLSMDFRQPRGIKEHIENENREESFAVFQKGRIPNLPNPIAQIANSYILAEDQDGLIIIDQHAAHERVIYDKLLASAEMKKMVSQPVLAAPTIDFSPMEADLLRENLSFLSELGFALDEFGGNTFVINSVPAESVKNDPISLLKGIVDDLLNNKTTNEMAKRRDTIIHYTACRSAVKFGQKLSHEEQCALIEQLFLVDRKETCPHGRPTMIRVTYNDLEVKFRRRV